MGYERKDITDAGDDDDWYDATAVGSNYEVQTSRRGNWRHRPIAARRPSLNRRDMSADRSFTPDYPWRPGTPPQDKSS